MSVSNSSGQNVLLLRCADRRPHGKDAYSMTLAQRLDIEESEQLVRLEELE